MVKTENKRKLALRQDGDDVVVGRWRRCEPKTAGQKPAS